MPWWEIQYLHILLVKRLAVEILIKVNLRVLGSKRIIRSNSVELVVLLSSGVEMMRCVVTSVLHNRGILDCEICHTRSFECQSECRIFHMLI